MDPSVSDINVHDTTKYVMKNCAVEVDESKVEHEFIALKERESDKLVFIQGSLKRENHNGAYETVGTKEETVEDVDLHGAYEFGV